MLWLKRKERRAKQEDFLGGVAEKFGQEAAERIREEMITEEDYSRFCHIADLLGLDIEEKVEEKEEEAVPESPEETPKAEEEKELTYDRSDKEEEEKETEQEETPVEAPKEKEKAMQEKKSAARPTNEASSLILDELKKLQKEVTALKLRGAAPKALQEKSAPVPTAPKSFVEKLTCGEIRPVAQAVAPLQ